MKIVVGLFIQIPVYKFAWRSFLLVLLGRDQLIYGGDIHPEGEYIADDGTTITVIDLYNRFYDIILSDDIYTYGRNNTTTATERVTVTLSDAGTLMVITVFLWTAYQNWTLKGYRADD